MGSPVLLTRYLDRAGWLALLLTSAARACLVVLATLVLWSVLPVALGWYSTVTMSGSMTPRIEPGDVVLSEPLDADATLRRGCILLVRSPAQPGTLLVHRMVGRAPGDAIRTRGDANPEVDSDPVPRADVLGEAKLLVPYVGRPYVWWHSGHPLTPGAVGTAAVLVLLVLLSGWYRHDEPRPPGPWWRRGPGSRRRADAGLPSRVRTGLVPAARGALLLGGVSVLAVLVVRLTPVPLHVVAPTTAQAAWKGTTSNPTSALDAGYYSCSRAPKKHSSVLFWKLDETSGSVVNDSSGTGNHGVYYGGVTLGQSKACATDSGTAVRLDGSSGYAVSSTAYSGPTQFSLELWFKTTTTAGGKLIGFESALAGWGWSYDRQVWMHDDGTLSFGVGSTTVTTSSAYNDGAWHLVDATFSSTGGMHFYLDGAQVGSSANTVSQSFTGWWRIGYGGLSGWPGHPTSEFFGGTLDDVVVYDSPLTATEVAGHYAARS
ncbi:LamG-like jellyroll fold domain-containing protein [Nocardioides sp. GY 10127]|uniref:LamG-like jellyroll fold domain-containing protein n=1 Tax=Nocardioides sp. GY 10127 TaxID=2569762 RepID=UPI0010A80CA9|nr:LamG-like jellyroll fold domain-containing protein [Nocardioides sp. GY 10127]TIC85529.1 hypothetical protein E8D37_02540 [Nocardioides sp. GY 10127]